LEKIAMMTFGAPIWFWTLAVIPVLALLFARAEQRGVVRLREFVSPRLLPQLAATVNRGRRVLRFAFLMLGLAFAIASLARPQWGYIYEDVKRKGLDLLFAVDTSRSMLSNDVQPNRLERVKLAAQDLVNQLQGDRVGLIAFAGRAFLQAPLTIDYEAAVESINDLDTKTIPEGGTNISEAINLALNTFGKSAAGNRALIVFTDGEELSGDAAKVAKAAAADAGVRIFTVGVGTPQGSLIPVTSDDGGTAFVKDSAGQVVKSKLDEKRLREIAQATGGFYLHLEDGPRTMSQLYSQGLANMKAAEIDARLGRRPIERYEWPLGAAMLALTMSILIRERKRVRVRARVPRWSKIAVPAAALILIFARPAFGAATGLNLYREGKYNDAYKSFQEDLQSHPDSSQKEKIEFDSGAAAFKMGDYNKALQSFSNALLSSDKGLQEGSHFNLGRTLEDRADMDQTNETTLKDLTDAAAHYESTLRLNPKNEAAKANLEEVKKKIERLKQHPKQKPTPTPPPQQQNKKDKNQQQNGGEQNQDQQQQSQSQSGSGKDQNQQQQQQNQQAQSQNQSGSSQSKDSQDKSNQAQAKNEPQKNQQPQAGETPSPSPGKQQEDQPSPSPGKGENKNAGATPSPSAGEQDRQSGRDQEKPEASPSPSGGEDQMPSPSPGEGEGEGENATPSATPSSSPQKKLAGEIKGANGDQEPQNPQNAAQLAETEAEKEGQMSEKQAELLLKSMKDEEQRVQLDERKVRRRVYNDW
jgi:Ca-activated chloride channel family protein